MTRIAIEIDAAGLVTVQVTPDSGEPSTLTFPSQQDALVPLAELLNDPSWGEVVGDDPGDPVELWNSLVAADPENPDFGWWLHKICTKNGSVYQDRSKDGRLYVQFESL